MRQFRLYDPGAHWCSASDFGAIVDVTERLKPRTVLEFGPGWSTLALIEGGAESIVGCEDKAHWLEVWIERLRPHQEQIRMVGYTWADPLPITAPVLGRETFDLGLVDGPAETEKRIAVLEFCLQRCAAVLIPLEETPALRGQGYLRPRALTMAERYGWRVELTDTGPLAGTFALLTA